MNYVNRNQYTESLPISQEKNKKKGETPTLSGARVGVSYLRQTGEQGGSEGVDGPQQIHQELVLLD